MRLKWAMPITIGIVSGIWMIIAWALGKAELVALAVPAWAGFVGMPLYFASGGGPKKLGVTFTGLLGGALMGMVMSLIADGLDFLPAPIPIAIGVGLGSWIVVAYSQIPWIPYVPAGFAGAASSFAFAMGYSGYKLIALVIAMFSGAFLGYVADVWGHAWEKEPMAKEQIVSQAPGKAQ